MCIAILAEYHSTIIEDNNQVFTKALEGEAQIH